MIKKSLIAMAISSIGFGTLYAGYIGPYIGPQDKQSLATVVEALMANEDTDVVFFGNIINSTNDGHYTFQDSTGKINVVIDDGNFKGINVTNKSKVTLYGEVYIDHENGKKVRSIDVDRITLK
jgi:uncharacterized protein (TIGR00156 family)